MQRSALEDVDGTRGFKEDLNFEELEDAIDLCEYEGPCQKEREDE